MAHQVRRTVRGKPVVAYACGQCGVELEAPLEEAGQRQPCPTCGTVAAVPGLADLKAWKAEQEAANRAEQTRLADIERLAAAKLEADQERQAAQRRKRVEQARPPTAGGADRFLTAVFRFAKGISVVVLVACLVGIAGGLVGYVLVRPEAPTRTVTAYVAPTLAEYSAQRQRAQSAAAPSDGRDAERGAAAVPAAATPWSRYQRVLARTVTNEFTREYALRDFDDIPYDRQEAFVAGLEAAVSQASAPADFVSWYVTTAKFRIESERRDAAARAAQQATAEAAAAARKQAMLALVVGAAGLLLSFLFLPLLIQIEQNTRWLYEVERRQAAAPAAGGPGGLG